MKNMKTFKEYVFEGSGDTCSCGKIKKKKVNKSLKSNKWIKWEDVKEEFNFFGKFKMEKVVNNIFKKIKEEFKSEPFVLNRLKVGHDAGETKLKYYKYYLSSGEKIQISVSEGGGEFNRRPMLFLDNQNISNDVSENTIKAIYNFLDDRYFEF
jgi:hypothetical protein